MMSQENLVIIQNLCDSIENENIMKMIKFIAITFFCAFICGCAATKVDPVDLYQGQSQAKIFTDGKIAMKKGQYDEAVKHFEALDAQYPFGPYTRQALLDLIYSYYESSDTGSALVTADRYIRLYPRGPNVDYAYYVRAVIQFNANHGFFERHFPVDFAKRNTTSLKNAFADFNQLVRYFPRSKYAADARQHMVYIRNILARHDLQVAQFYYDRKTYVGAANRANEVVQHYQETPSVPAALALMAKSYQKLGLTKDENEALRVLRLNFPNYKE